jgi:hypothetical protein
VAFAWIAEKQIVDVAQQIPIRWIYVGPLLANRVVNSGAVMTGGRRATTNGDAVPLDVAGANVVA